MMAKPWHLHRKDTLGFLRKLFSPCFLLAVHMLTASKKRKEEACRHGKGTPAHPERPGSSSGRMWSACSLRTRWFLGSWQKAAVDRLVEERPPAEAQHRGSWCKALEKAPLSHCKTPHHSLSTNRQVTLPVLDEGKHRGPGPSDGSKTWGSLSASEPSVVLCLACHVNMSHPRGTEMRLQSLPASSPVLLVPSDLVKK